MAKSRLDEWLVDKGHYPSRARARDAILRGCVRLSGELSPKPSRTVPNDDAVQIDDPALNYVSRAALKLDHALEKTGYGPEGCIALDIGASTGGFCQILLERGATHVYGVDVGHDQLAEALIKEPKLTNLEGLNARDLTLAHLDGNRPQFITSDVSFISLKLALPPALELADNNAIGIFLVKPQFEVGKDGIGRGGIVRDETLALKSAENVRDWLGELPDWRVTHFFPAPITGGDGNQEYLLAGVKNG
ncbi:MAG: TlyA family RNA methyltransferase [Pseudomonadota bacterium]